MKSTLAINKQLFNVKDIAYATEIEDLQDGQFGIYAEDSSLSIANTGAGLPTKFRMIAKNNGKTYFSVDIVQESEIYNTIAKDYQAPVTEVHEATIDDCACVDHFVLNISIDEDDLRRRDGLTWAHKDFVVGLTPEELACLCKDAGCACPATEIEFGTYQNHLITAALVEKVNAKNSTYYEAEAKISVVGISVYASAAARDAAEPTPATGDLAITSDDAALTQYNGTAWETVGTEDGVITDADAYTANGKDLNTDADQTNDTPMMVFVLKSKSQTTPNYSDLEVNYIYPRGIKLSPSLNIGGKKTISFTRTQDLVFEINAGYDLRKEEFDNMNYYTNLNFYPTLSDGIAAPGLVYQFENGVNYDTIYFEFSTPKTERAGTGDTKAFGVLLGAQTGTSESTDLKTLFGV